MDISPDYLPLLFVSRQDLQENHTLFDILLDKLKRVGVRISFVAGNSFAGSGEKSQTFINETISRCDLVIIENSAPDAAPRLVLGQSVTDAQDMACRDEKGIEVCIGSILDWLADCLDKTPVYGCVLIGGKSARMGRAKHLLSAVDGLTWLEKTIIRLSSFTTDVVISGDGEVPAHLVRYERIQDIPGSSGPVSGIGAVLKAHPFVSWLVLACDMPDISGESLRWLLSQRRPGAVAVIPRNPLSDRSEPLCGWYDFRSAPHIEKMLAKGEQRIRHICQHDSVYEPVIPEHLCSCFRNVNRPGEL
jgi:molybdopterin-guanine dinucleotide biosynthesis protein A